MNAIPRIRGRVGKGEDDKFYFEISIVCRRWKLHFRDRLSA